MPRNYIVYILFGPGRMTYVGVTNNPYRRLAQHRAAGPDTYVGKHGIHRLVHVEVFQPARDAITREKQIKGWVRRRKLDLVRTTNPGFKDLAVEWGWEIGVP